VSNAPATAAPLDDVMLAMDVVDTLRHRQDLVTRELDEATREKQLVEKLRELYRQQGIEVPDHILKEGVDALAESRFVYDPPKPGFGTTLARMYVARKRWGPAAIALGLVLVVGLFGYFGVYRPMVQGQIEAARVELAETIPSQMDALYATIFEETKVQQAVTQADAVRTRGKTAASEGNREDALDAIRDLTAIRDTVRQEYQLVIVSRGGERSAVWRFPDINTDASNYYLIVEALDTDRKPLSLPILNEETGEVSTVAKWGVRVPEEVYRVVEADKTDDGIIQGNVIGIKQFGFLDVDYAVPTLPPSAPGMITDWSQQ
jgi:hypothetical protein